MDTQNMSTKELEARVRSNLRQLGSSGRPVPSMTAAFQPHLEQMAEETRAMEEELDRRRTDGQAGVL